MPETLNNNGVLTPVQRIFRLLGRYRNEIKYLILYAVVVGLINLSLPLGVQAIIGLIAGGSMAASWGVLILFILVGALLAGVLRLAQLSLMEHLQRRVFTDASMEFSLRIPRLNLERLRREHLPELVNRFFDTLTLQKGLPKVLIDGSTAVLQILFSLLLLSFYNSGFVVSILLLLSIVAIVVWWTGARGLQTSLKESKYKYKLAYWLEEVGRVSTTFKQAGDNRFAVEHADALTLEYLDARARHWRILVIQFVSSVAFRVLALGFFLVLGSVLVINNELNIGQFVASEILVLFIIESVEKLVLLHETGYDILTAIEKIGQVADLPVEREDGIKQEELGSVGKPLQVELRNLSYQFEDGHTPVLVNIQITLNAGERIALAGYNGSGKSTLLKVLSGMKHDFTGSVLFNGLPLSNLNLRSLRGHIGDFSSHEDIFKGTLEENITIGRDKIDLKAVLTAAESVGLQTFIQELPQGVHTELLPGGKNLPRSIITKILLARAIAGIPQLLVLEDPLHTLNQSDRLLVSRLLVNRTYPWTLICSTEDPVMAAMCDRILILDQGAIVFDGNFEQVQKTEHYSRVFRVVPNETENQAPKNA